mmetsp:Transcript_35466/g.70368  ORF Transcript_35466/g.70368 Transcript_35466/m.70368 type:complete len:633 (+) Transcript_35466:45-1943(+)
MIICIGVLLALPTIYGASLVLNPASSASAGGGVVTTTWSGLNLDNADHQIVRSHEKVVDPRPGHGSTQRWLDDGLWVGMFPAGADVSPIAEIAWPATGPLTATSPWRYIPLDECPEGSFSWSMDSKVRSNVDFVLFQGGFDFPQELARATLRVTDADAVGQVRLARTLQGVGEMKVLWNEKGGEPGSVSWWLDGDSTEHEVAEAEDAPRTITLEDVCGVPAKTAGWLNPGYTHQATLDLAGVKAGTKVNYRVVSGNSGGSGSASFAFTAPRGGGDLGGSNRFLLLADMGCTYEDGSHYHWEEPDAKNTTAHVARWAKDGYSELAFFIGDLSYATGYASKWDKHLTSVESAAAYLPLMVGKGNHEQDDASQPPNADSPQAVQSGNDAGGECGVAADLRYVMPYPIPASPPPPPPPSRWDSGGGDGDVVSEAGRAARGWYSLNAGAVHFAVTNSELNCTAGSEQYEWLDADLKSVNRSATPWVVVMGHRPIWDASSLNKVDPYEDLNVKALETLMLAWKVDLSLYGHEHYAELTCPLKSGGRCAGPEDQDADGWGATVHAVIGNAGQSLTAFPAVRPFYDVYEGHEWGFSSLEANATHCSLFFWGDAPEDQDPPLRFASTMVRSYPRTAAPQAA